jgi:arsenite methyltransferase
MTTEPTTKNAPAMSAEEIKEQVRRAYGRRASRFVETRPRASCCAPAQQTSCCGQAEATETCCAPAQETSCCATSQEASCCEATAAADECCSPAAEKGESGGARRLYSEGELSDLPESVTGASAGCGNPTAIASLRPGEVVLDLGSGGGIDCFLAAKQVGPTGQVIGLDMTTEMIRLARRNAKKMGVTNVDFRYGEIEEMPIGDETVDVILSNCVINLSPDKDAVFSEAYRVLKPGGRMSVSDIVVDGDLPAPLRRSIDAWAGCVAGALDERVYLDKMRAAGLADVEVTQRAYADVSGWLSREDVQELMRQQDPPLSADEVAAQLKSTVASVTVVARKPGAASA